MNEETKTEETKTVVVELPRYLDVKGKARHTEMLDLEKWKPELVSSAIAQACRIWVTRRSASPAGTRSYEDKILVEDEAWKHCLEGTYAPGKGGGGGPSVSIRMEEERKLLGDYFLKEGIKNKTDREKRAKAKDGWYQYFLLMITRKVGKAPSPEAVQAKLDKFMPMIDKKIDDAVAARKALVNDTEFDD